jgi:hypothetical protein
VPIPLAIGDRTRNVVVLGLCGCLFGSGFALVPHCSSWAFDGVDGGSTRWILVLPFGFSVGLPLLQVLLTIMVDLRWWVRGLCALLALASLVSSVFSMLLISWTHH